MPIFLVAFGALNPKTLHAHFVAFGALNCKPLHAHLVEFGALNPKTQHDHFVALGHPTFSMQKKQFFFIPLHDDIFTTMYMEVVKWMQ
jgi:hypothetical protein